MAKVFPTSLKMKAVWEFLSEIADLDYAVEYRIEGREVYLEVIPFANCEMFKELLSFGFTGCKGLESQPSYNYYLLVGFTTK